MQKIVNGIALLSGVVTLSLIGGGVYLFVNKDALIDKVKVYATEEIQKTLSKSLPSMVPSIPKTTGLPINQPFNGIK
tara:strand:+ start:3899 stop:4129 length:231 start_codon:yes stop_codon:yes gene_type:complete